LKGAVSPVGSLLVTERGIDIASTFCGSYHILDMGRHFRDYFVSNTLLSFPPCAGLPLAHPYAELGHKSKATSVTGNTGEAVAGMVGRRLLDLNTNEIVHIKARGKMKSPDCMFRAGHRLPGVLAAGFPTSYGHPLPAWWPVEAKARGSPRETLRAIEKEAYVQLAAFWHAIRTTCPQDVGFGLAVGLACEKRMMLEIVVFFPKDQVRLRTHLQSRTPAKYLAAIESGKDTITRGCLYDC
jgi:hypothetical protein